MALRTFAGGALFGERHGSDPPSVLALHGWGRTHRDFDAVLEGLAAIAIDLPGFGATPPPPHAWGSAEYAAAVQPVFDEMAPPVVVLGHSMGGRIAVHLAAGWPEAVRALVLSGVPLIRSREYGARRPPLGYRLAKAAHRAGLLSDGRMEEIRYKRSAPDWQRAAGIMRDVFTRLVNETYEDQLRAITCPVELVWGEDDTAAPVAMADAAAGLLRDGHLHRHAGVGHMTPIQIPDALRAAAERVLA